MRSHAAGAIRAGLLILCWLALPSQASDVRITLPLEGYYRPGKYMPMRIEMRGARAEARLRLSGDVAIPTDVVAPAGALSCVAALLPMEEGPWRVRWSLGEEGGVVEGALRALEPGQRLIGVTASSDAEVGERLFPGSAVIPVRVEPADLARAEPGAWNALDAVVVEAGVLDESQASALLSSGVSVAIRADEAPFGRGNWPWERIGSWWVLRSQPLGPANRAAVLPSAFAPVQGRHAGWPAAFRYLMALLAVVAAVFILMAAMIRKRWTAGLVVLVSIIATGALHHAWKRFSPLVTRHGSITVARDGVRQDDAWTYQAAARPVSVTSDATRGTMPFFEREGDWRAIGLRVECDSNGHPTLFRYELSPPYQMALMRRIVGKAAVDDSTPSAGDSPMAGLARRAYLQPGYSIAGVRPASERPPTDLMTEHFPTVVIARQRTHEGGVSIDAGRRD